MIQRAIYCNTNANEKIISGANIRHFQRKCLTGLLENRLPLGSTQYNTHPLENVSFRSYFLGLKDVLGILALVQHAILATDRSNKTTPLSSPLFTTLGSGHQGAITLGDVAFLRSLHPGNPETVSCSTESTNTPFAAFMGVKGGVHKRTAGLTLLL